jgi:beta-lactamase class D
MKTLKSSLIILFIGMLILCPKHSFSQSVVLETVNNQTIILGDTNMVNVLVTPASTFKIVIGWSGLERKVVTPETKHRSNDKHVPGTPRDITLKEAMYYSSNDYFLWLADQIGSKNLIKDVSQSGFFGEEIPNDWLGEDKSSVSHGGRLKVTAQKEHEFIQRVMTGKLASSPEIQERLLEVLKWPGVGDSPIQFYGKTGSYEGVFWFNGFGKEKDTLKAVTVLMKGKGSSRDKAIEAFYKKWGKSKPPL